MRLPRFPDLFFRVFNLEALNASRAKKRSMLRRLIPHENIIFLKMTSLFRTVSLNDEETIVKKHSRSFLDPFLPFDDVEDLFILRVDIHVIF